MTEQEMRAQIDFVANMFRKEHDKAATESDKQFAHMMICLTNLMGEVAIDIKRMANAADATR
jgi:hypothetical protein